MKAEPRRVSPSDAIEITRIFVFSFNVSTPLRTVFRTSACSCPDSRLQSPDTRMGRAGYIRLSLYRRPSAATVT